MNDGIFGSSPEGGIGKVGGQYFIIGRVTSVVLSEYLDDNKTKNPDWTNDGDLGKIDFEILYTGLNLSRSNKVSKSAWPVFSFIRQYPLINEIVYIVSGPSNELNDNYKNQGLFYFPPFSVWNSANHNAFPNMDQYSEFLKDFYQKSGYEGQADTTLAKLPLGQAFQENEKVRSLSPFEGDTLIEGRFGQSIRFGSSNTVRATKNNWSTNKESNGKPITILINGQGTPRVENLDKFMTTVEDIDRDDSSIYLTSGQQVKIDSVKDINPSVKEISDPLVPYKTYFSQTYKFPFIGNQVIVASDRVFIYAKKENALIYSRQNVGIVSVKDTSISSERTIIESKTIYLGEDSANESAILGDSFTRELVCVLENLQSVAAALSSISTTGLAAATAKIAMSGIVLDRSISDMLSYIRPINGKGKHLSQITYLK